MGAWATHASYTEPLPTCIYMLPFNPLFLSCFTSLTYSLCFPLNWSVILDSILQKSDSNWKKSSTYYVMTSYVQPLLLWTGATLICRYDLCRITVSLIVHLYWCLIALIFQAINFQGKICFSIIFHFSWESTNHLPLSFCCLSKKIHATAQRNSLLHINQSNTALSNWKEKSILFIVYSHVNGFLGYLIFLADHWIQWFSLQKLVRLLSSGSWILWDHCLLCWPLLIAYQGESCFSFSWLGVGVCWGGGWLKFYSFLQISFICINILFHFSHILL